MMAKRCNTRSTREPGQPLQCQDIYIEPEGQSIIDYIGIGTGFSLCAAVIGLLIAWLHWKVLLIPAGIGLMYLIGRGVNWVLAERFERRRS